MKTKLAAGIKLRGVIDPGYGAGSRVRKAGFLLFCMSAALLLLASCGSSGRDAGGAVEDGGGTSTAAVADASAEGIAEEGHEEGDTQDADDHQDAAADGDVHEEGDSHDAADQDAAAGGDVHVEGDTHNADDHQDAAADGDVHEEGDTHDAADQDAAADGDVHVEGDSHDAADHDATELNFTAEVERGTETYRTVGCSGCHGEGGEGTAIAPALANHTPEQVRAQVRSPRPGSVMPAFAEETLGDNELEDIIAFITTLEGEGHEHMHAEEVEQTPVIEMHHWMAISALKAGNMDEALHHVSHIRDAVEGDHLAAMVAVAGFIEAGDLHAAEHDIEEMLAAAPEFSTDIHELHLELALQSVELGRGEEAGHHLVHFADLAEGSEDAASARAAAEAADSGELDEAERVIRELIEAAESGGEHPEDDHDHPAEESGGDAPAEVAEADAHAEEEGDHTH